MNELISVLGAGLAVGLVSRLAPEAAGSGIPHLKAVLYWLRSMRWQAIVPVKFFGGVAGIGGGLALGREGQPSKWEVRWVLRSPTGSE